MNFVFFMPDELRAESVGSYGNQLAPTPNIDRLASQGTRFEQCHVQHSVCTPSRCSLMTGWYPHVRGHRTLWHMLRPDEPNLLRYLKQAGYQVYWYGKNDLLAQDSFADSVTVAEQRGSGMFGKNAFARDDPRFGSFLYEPYDGPLEEHGDYANVQAGLDFLRSKPKEPFILYLPLTFPHCPYSAPQPWHDMIDPDDLPPLRPSDLPDRPEYHELIRRYRHLAELAPDEQEQLLRKIHAVYLGMTGYIDHLLGHVLDTLDETGLSDSTTVTFFSDHGDFAGDFGLVEKWPSACEDIITRVPLIVRTPGGAQGHVVEEPMELFDIMATTLEQAGIEPQHTHFARSYVAKLSGLFGDPERIAYTEGGYDPHEPHCFEGRASRDQFARDSTHIYFPKGLQQQEEPQTVYRVVAMRTQNYHMVYRPEGQCELYDVREDPRELYNCYDVPLYASIRAELQIQLLDWMIRTSDVTPFDMDSRSMPG